MANGEERLATLEQELAALSAQVTTRRLVVVDVEGRPRIVADVVGSTAELRLLSGAGTETRSAASVVAHATGGTGDGDGDGAELGPLVGVQLWAGGDVVAELDIWPEPDGRWRPHLHLEDPP